MAITKTVEIDGRPVTFKASAAIPRYYRFKFRRDILKDLQNLGHEVSGGDEGESTISINSLEVFENIAYMMAKYADDSVPDSPEEWLDQFTTFSIYQLLPVLLELWGLNMETQVESKKKFARLTAK